MAPAAAAARGEAGDLEAEPLGEDGDPVGSLFNSGGSGGPSATAARPGQPAPAAPQAPPTAAFVADRLAVAIESRSEGVTEVRLDPPELGRVRLSLGPGDHVLSATVIAERPEVADLMRRHGDLLASALAAAGHEGAELHFGAEQDGSRCGSDGAPQLEEEPASSPAAAAPPVRPRRAAGLDMRV